MARNGKTTEEGNMDGKLAIRDRSAKQTTAGIREEEDWNSAE